MNEHRLLHRYHYLRSQYRRKPCCVLINSSQSSGKCCNVVYLVFQTSFADCLAVFGVVSLSLRCVDYKANFLVHNHIYNIRAAGTNLVYYIALDSVCVVEVCSSLSSNQSETEVFKCFTNHKNLAFLIFFIT